jgi:hypothetical protein
MIPIALLLLWTRNNIIFYQTVRNRLRQSGLRSRRALKGMELKPRHRIARLQWARSRLRGGETLGRTFCFLINPSLI